MSSDQTFFLIEKIRSTGADVSGKQNTNLAMFFVNKSLEQLDTFVQEM